MNCTAAELAQYLGAIFEGDGRQLISGVASLERAGANDLIYLASPRHRERAEKSAALCVLAPSGERLAGKTILAVKDPKFAFTKAAAQAF